MADDFKMVDLKRPKESLKPKSVGRMTQDPYSYDHRISLDPDTMEKLGMDVPKVGDKFHVMGHAEVRSVSQHEDSEGGKGGRVELQLKKMALRKKSGPGSGGMKSALESGINQAGESDDE